MSNEIMNRPEFGLQNGTTAAAAPAPVITAQAREVARVQGEILMAKKFPRNEAESLRSIEAVCSRTTLAQSAIYEYAKGGTLVAGASIRLAEQLARCWKNMRYGFEVLDSDASHSVVRAYSYDIESNVQAERTFTVPHEMGLKGGKKKVLTDPREVYEHIANQSARRVRACILETIPGDIVDYAVELCNRTVQAGVKITPDALQNLLAAFAPFGVTQPMIEARIQSKLTAISTRNFVELKRVWTSINDGIGKPEDYFDFAVKEQEAATNTAAPALGFTSAPAKAPRARKAAQEAVPAPQPQEAPQQPAPAPVYATPDDGLDDIPEDDFAGAEEAFGDLPF